MWFVSSGEMINISLIDRIDNTAMTIGSGNVLSKPLVFRLSKPLAFKAWIACGKDSVWF